MQRCRRTDGKMKMLNDRKGQGTMFLASLIGFAVIGIICVMFFAMWIYGTSLVNTTLQSVNLGSAANMTQITQNTLGNVVQGYQYLPTISFMIILGFLLSTIIVAYYTTEYPIMTVVYFVFVALLIIFSVYISNAYNSMLNNPLLAPMLSSFTMSNYIISYLPEWVGTIGFIGIILMIGRLIKDQGGTGL